MNRKTDGIVLLSLEDPINIYRNLAEFLHQRDPKEPIFCWTPPSLRGSVSALFSDFGIPSTSICFLPSDRFTYWKYHYQEATIHFLKSIRKRLRPAYYYGNYFIHQALSYTAFRRIKKLLRRLLSRDQHKAHSSFKFSSQKHPSPMFSLQLPRQLRHPRHAKNHPITTWYVPTKMHPLPYNGYILSTTKPLDLLPFLKKDPSLPRKQALDIIKAYQESGNWTPYLTTFYFPAMRFIFCPASSLHDPIFLTLISAYATLLRRKFCNIKLILGAPAHPVVTRAVAKLRLEYDVLFVPIPSLSVLAALYHLAELTLALKAAGIDAKKTFQESCSLGTPALTDSENNDISPKDLLCWDDLEKATDSILSALTKKEHLLTDCQESCR